jgi:hypothetical protein
MATQDISRFLHQPNKHYSTAHMQQGRVVVDSDFNERSMIEAEDLRASLVDIVCASGTPNDGMLVSDVQLQNVDPPGSPVAVNTCDFTLKAGSYYLGGLRLELDEDETFLAQKDWLQIDATGADLPAQPTDGRNDLVFVMAWEHPVTAVEDSELREVALGDRDTSVRIKRMRQFGVKTNLTATTRTEAFDELTAELITNYGGSFDAENSEFISGATLQVGFVAPTEIEDLCAESTASGYVAAENQAIRVELRSGDKLVWGYDNASKIYRVLGDSNNLDQLTFVDEPADLPSMPRAGQVVEILPWGARLPNQEKVAEREGLVTSVATTYDPETKMLVIDDPLNADWLSWLSFHSSYHNNRDANAEYLYLRVWDRGSELVDVPNSIFAEIPYDPNGASAVPLGTTGLEVTITGGMPGDYWIISARPNTPDEVTPWDMGIAGVPPHGPRRFYAPLAMIQWSDPGSGLVGTPVDWRTKFRRLCEAGCCTLTVGDGKRSFGHVNTLQEALDLVPDGGKVCVLPGVHIGTALLEDAVSVVIEGCGPESVLVSPTPDVGDDATSNAELFYDPVLTIRDSTEVVVKNLRIEAYSSVGVMIEKSAVPNDCEDMLLEGLEVFSSGGIDANQSVYEFAAPCVAVLGASDVVIRRCELEMDEVPSLAAAVVLSGYRMKLLESRVTAPVYDGMVLAAMGGVQVRSATYEVDIIGCEIDGGWGNGISLGQVESFARTNETTLSAWDIHSKPVGGGAAWLTNGNMGAMQYVPGGSEQGSGEVAVWLPTGPVEKVRIHDNVIRNMGLSGIATMEFFSSNFSWEDENTTAPVFIVAVDIDISRNTIEENVKLENQLTSYFAQLNDRCAGGVCLAASMNATIRENQILRNGLGILQAPICGVGLVAAQNVAIEDNRIIDNGPPAVLAETPPAYGLRGGIAIHEVTPLLGYTFAAGTDPAVDGPTMPRTVKDFQGSSEGSALVVRCNEVRQPVGRALWVQRGFGAVTVTGNNFTSFGNPVAGDAITGAYLQWVNGNSFFRPASGACVEIVDFGLALDVDWDSLTPPTPVWADTSNSTVSGGTVLVTGNVMSLDWDVLGGCTSSVLVSTLGSAVFDSNSSFVTTRNPYGDTIPLKYPLEPMKSLLEDVISSFDVMSFVMTNVYVGSASTVQAIGNRLIEGELDALFSLVAGPAPAPTDDDVGTLRHASALAGNVGTHCGVAGFDSTTTLDTNNIAIQTDSGAIVCGGYSVVEAVLGLGVRVISVS